MSVDYDFGYIVELLIPGGKRKSKAMFERSFFLVLQKISYGGLS